jgi:hypothetical protein
MSNHHLKSVATWVWIGLFMLAVGYQERAHSYSCHLCRNSKTAKTIRFFWVPLHSFTRTSHRYRVPSGHQHDWFGYTNYEMIGYNGCIMFRLGCSTRMYRDNKLPGHDFPEPQRN